VGEFVERDADMVHLRLVGHELVVAAAQVMHERVAIRDCARRPDPLEPAVQATLT
jgi:hypothetical protein